MTPQKRQRDGTSLNGELELCAGAPALLREQLAASPPSAGLVDPRGWAVL